MAADSPYNHSLEWAKIDIRDKRERGEYIRGQQEVEEWWARASQFILEGFLPGEDWMNYEGEKQIETYQKALEYSRKFDGTPLDKQHLAELNELAHRFSPLTIAGIVDNATMALFNVGLKIIGPNVAPFTAARWVFVPPPSL